MPVDPEKLRKSYIKKARNILRLTPEKQEKAKKKLRESLKKRDQDIQDFETALSLYRNKDEKGLIKHTEALRKRARAEGRDEKISDVRVPIKRTEYLKNKAKYDAIPWEDRPSTPPKTKTVEQWWDGEVAGLEEKLENTKADRGNLFEDNRTLLELEIDDLEGQKAIITPLKFENMKEHFGGKLVHKLEEGEGNAIEKQVKSEKAAIKKAAKAEKPDISETELSSKVNAALNKRRKDLFIAKLTDKNKARFTEIRDNELYRIDYGLKELQVDHKKLTGKKYVPEKTD